MSATGDDGFYDSASIFGSTMSLASSGSGGSSDTSTDAGQKGKKGSTNRPPPHQPKSPSMASQPLTSLTSQPASSKADGDVALALAFNNEVRPLLDFVDKLRALGLEQNKLTIPRIAIIGDQSSGKSSVVEALSQVPLPRGTGIVTRAPLQLRMINDPTVAWSAKLSYKLNGKDETFAVNSPTEVEKQVKDAQTAITGGNEKSISDVEIELEVISRAVPDLTVVDLPGIVRVATAGQDADIEQKVKDLIHKYIDQANTIILVVCPANVDIEVHEALKLAKKVDPIGQRTLGVVTKPDLVDKGAEGATMHIVNNQSSITLAGASPWVVVKGRSQEDINNNMPIDQAMTQEENFFQGHKHYKHLDRDRRGVKTLATKLTKVLIEKIKEILPDLRQQLNDSIQAMGVEMERLGPTPPEDVTDLKIYFIKVINVFCDILRSECLGDYHRVPNSCQLLPRTREMFDDLAHKIENNRPDTADHLPSTDGATATATTSAGGSKDTALLTVIKQDMKSLRGRELLPYTKFSVFEANIRKFVKECRDPMLDCLQDVYQLVDYEFQQMAQDNMRMFPILEARTRNIITNLCKDAFARCKDGLEEYMEMENMIYTQDNIYAQEVKLVAKVTKSEVDPETSEPKMATPNLEKVPVLTEDMDDWCSREAQKHLLNLKAYFRVASRRIMENVPMKIQYAMLRQLSIDIQNEITAITTLVDDDAMREMGEDPRITRQRQEIQDKIVELEKCRRLYDCWASGSITIPV